MDPTWVELAYNCEAWGGLQSYVYNHTSSIVCQFNHFFALEAQEHFVYWDTLWTCIESIFKPPSYIPSKLGNF